MFIDLLLKLVDRLLDLAKRQEEVNKALFVNFIQPAFETFEVVHTDYIDSLVRYSSRIADKTLKMDLNHPIFADLELDALKTDHLRAKLADFKPKESPEKLQPFLTAITFYLRGVSESADHADLITKLAGDASHSISPNDLQSLLLKGRSPIELLERDSKDAYFPFLVSDPLRMTLRQVFVGEDAPRPENDDEDREILTEGLTQPGWEGEDLMRRSDDDRRRSCLRALKVAMDHFQVLYRMVSSEYAGLRSKLMTAG